MTRSLAAVLLLTLVTAGCDFAPDYQRPVPPTPASFKENGDWKTASPAELAPRGPWWSLFADSRLDRLEDRLDRDNQTLKQALARHEQAAAAARYAGAAYYPQVSYSSGATRQQGSRDSAIVTHPNLYNDANVEARVSWEVDLWGRVRNLAGAAQSRAEASAADLAAARLSLEAELANDYLMLQGLDAQQDMLDRTVKDDEDALSFTQRRHDGGAAAEVDVDQAEAQLALSKTQAANNRLSRSQMEHAVAILVGDAPADFSLPSQPLTGTPPAIAAGLPSALLERRPDIAAAEKRVAAANADIGVARAAYFPVFDLTALVGTDAALPQNLLKSASTLWAIGPQASGTLFDGGQRSAATDQARAAFDEAAAVYRQTVLDAYGEVEDNLAALRQLAEEAATQATAVDAARRALGQAQTRYKGGLANYLEVISAQNVALTAESGAIDIRTRRMAAAVSLIRAIGGGWRAEQDAAAAA